LRKASKRRNGRTAQPRRILSSGRSTSGVAYPASLILFAESGNLQDDFASADCADARAPTCANLILDNLDDWAAWYETNG
jgi:hypothetical protein